MRIDAHHHLWDAGTREQRWTHGVPVLERSFLPAELKVLFDRAGIDRGIVVETQHDIDSTIELLAWCAATEHLAGVVGWVDLEAGDVGDQIARLRQSPGGEALVGIRHLVHLETDPRWLCRPSVRRGLRALGDVGLAYDVVVTPQQLEAVSDVVHGLPDVRFVLDHLGNPGICAKELEPWRTNMRRLAHAPNVAIKLSGLVTLADREAWTVDDLRPFTDTALDLFPADRIMYGSDWPVCLLAATFSEVVCAAQVLVAELSRDEQAHIFGGSARAWYRLDTL